MTSQSGTRLSSATQRSALRAEVEEFLYEEAALLDDWRLEEWAGLFTEDAVSLVPAPDNPGGDPGDSLYLVADDLQTLQSRVRQLMGRSAWAENPRSQTRRVISNVRLLSVDDKEIRSTANFMLQRSRRGQLDFFVGRYEHRLVREGGTFKIAERKVLLNQDTLRPQGMISVIL